MQEKKGNILTLNSKVKTAQYLTQSKDYFDFICEPHWLLKLKLSQASWGLFHIELQQSLSMSNWHFLDAAAHHHNLFLLNNPLKWIGIRL